MPAPVSPRDLLPPDGYAHTIDSPEGPVYYLEAGTGEPLLLVSAWGPTPGSTAWLLYRDVLAVLSKSYRCIVVELTKTEPKLLERYLGKLEAQEFLQYQAQRKPPVISH